MSNDTVLVVEDNPITRKMVRVALESEGFSVIEAGDGRSALAAARERQPALVILDYVLPDTDGLELLAGLRQLLGRSELPALLVTGMVSRLSDLRGRADEHTELLAKPIEPARLIAVVRAHLGVAPSLGAVGKLILVVDDEQLNLKLAALQLGHRGYRVATASTAHEALGKARELRPDAILAHVGLPALDGFALCRQVRADPLLVGVPVVLFSGAYLEDADRELARRLGAADLVPRTADLGAAAEALRRIFADAAASSVSVAPTEVEGLTADLEMLYRERLQAQLERQTAENRALQRQAGIQSSALALLRSLSEVLGQPANVAEVIGEVLVECLDAAGLSTGVLYFVEQGAYRLQAHSGITVRQRQDAEGCFGHREVLDAVVAAGHPTALQAVDGPTISDFLARLGSQSTLAVPFIVMGRVFGVLILASEQQDLTDVAWLGFAGALALQFSQTVALGLSLNRLAASEINYGVLLEQASDAVLILDPTGRILVANQTAHDLLAMGGETLVGRGYDEFVVPEERYEAQHNRQSLRERPQIRIPIRHLLRGEGSRISVEASMSQVRGESESNLLIVWRDITERLQLEAQFQQAQRMESVGRLAGGVAHDFNNLLTIILGYGSALKSAIADPTLIAHVDEILHAGESAAGLTRQLLAFSRRQVMVPVILDVNALLRKLEVMLRRVIGEDIELLTDLDPRLGRIRADAGQIEQVVMNLVVNARDAMPKGGRLTISTRQLAVHPDPQASPPSWPAGEIALGVTDTGTGIEASVLPHLFEPFFTTKEEGKGTGLGLATVYGIVRQSGGRVEAHSGPGKGATFVVYLPCTKDPVLDAASEEAPPRGGTETILVVEDDPDIRNLERSILVGHGYRVFVASNASEALKLADSLGGQIDLLLTDVIMPGTSGVRLAELLTAWHPDVRVLYASGYAEPALELQGAGVHFLQKPFDPGILLRRVRAALDQNRS